MRTWDVTQHRGAPATLADGRRVLPGDYVAIDRASGALLVSSPYAGSSPMGELP